MLAVGQLLGGSELGGKHLEVGLGCIDVAGLRGRLDRLVAHSEHALLCDLGGIGVGGRAGLGLFEIAEGRIDRLSGGRGVVGLRGKSLLVGGLGIAGLALSHRVHDVLEGRLGALLFLVVVAGHTRHRGERERKREHQDPWFWRGVHASLLCGETAVDLGPPKQEVFLYLAGPS